MPFAVAEAPESHAKGPKTQYALKGLIVPAVMVVSMKETGDP